MGAVGNKTLVLKLMCSMWRTFSEMLHHIFCKNCSFYICRKKWKAIICFLVNAVWIKRKTSPIWKFTTWMSINLSLIEKRVLSYIHRGKCSCQLKGIFVFWPLKNNHDKSCISTQWNKFTFCEFIIVRNLHSVALLYVEFTCLDLNVYALF